MTRYQRIAEINQDRDLELFEAAEYLNGDMGDFYIMWEYPSTYYLVKEEEDGNFFVGGEIDELEGDVYGATDEVGEHLDSGYRIVEFPSGNRRLAWFDEE